MNVKRCYEFGQDQVEAIDSLAERLNVRKSDVLRLGLTLLRHAVSEAAAGNALGVIRGERVVKELSGAWTDMGPPKAA